MKRKVTLFLLSILAGCGPAPTQRAPEPSPLPTAEAPAKANRLVSKHDEPKVVPPWDISSVTKLSTARPGRAAVADAGPKEYLRVVVHYNGTPEARKKHKFRVLNQRGEEVGELWGWDDDRSTVIFKGRWSSLDGLYLVGLRHREPLIAIAPAK
jgi:hypothetical protein